MHWCAAANPAEPLPHKRTAPVRMRRVLSPPEGKYCAIFDASPRTIRNADRPGCM